MDIVIMQTPGCPNTEAACRRVAQALSDAGLPAVDIRVETVSGPEDAERLGFRGSPTILIDGEDPFAVEGTPSAFACRIYSTDGVRDDAPSVEQIREAIEAHVSNAAG
jgi:glutaredoxin